MKTLQRTAFALAAIGAAGLLTGCWEAPPPDTVQHGYRGTGMVHLSNPRTAALLEAANQAPEVVPAVPPGGPLAKDIYKNVKVLTDLDVGQFTRLMVAMTAWVAPPEQGCNYCHKDGNFELDGVDALYTKHVARRMLEMTRHVNTTWTQHVVATGVTCYTCHRGKPVPANSWVTDPAVQTVPTNFAGWKYGQNTPSKNVAWSSLPIDPFTPFLLNNGEIRIHTMQPLPTGVGTNLRHAEWTYGLMMHLSDGLGVNCTYCHNSNHFASWEGAPPQKTSAWYGIRMVRDLNQVYLAPLQSQLPANRLGPAGDAPKANCTTCHQGVFKPILGAPMLAHYPELGGPKPAAAMVAAAPATGTIGQILFAVDKTDLSAEAMSVVAQTMATMRENPKIKVDLSGFADQTGNYEHNLQLAKNRAMAIRDALKVAGVAEDRINLKKPETVVGGLAGESRRVDIVVVK